MMGRLVTGGDRPVSRVPAVRSVADRVGCMPLTSTFALAAHALALLATKGEEGATSEFIASSASTHPARVRRVLAVLGREGIVDGREGAHGGYRLARPAAEITLAEVLESLGESTIFPLHPQAPNARCRVGRGITAALEAVDREAGVAILDVLAGRTVEWLKDRALAESR